MSWGKISRSKADTVYSEYIRKKSKGYCECCTRFFGWQSLQCSHYFGRRHRAVRFDPMNTFALCPSCHRKFGENPNDHTDWVKGKIDEKQFALLKVKAKCGVPVKKRDEALIIIWVKQELKKLEGVC